MIFVESLEVLAYRILVVEAFGHKYCHCLGQRETTHRKELEDIVKACRVAHSFLNDRPQVLDVAQSLAAEHALPCLHPSAIASNGIDFTIMCQQTEGLRQLPFREGIGRETRMHEGKSARKVWA